MSEVTPKTPVAATPPTPENVADMLTMGDNDYHDGNNWKPSLYADGNMLHIRITPYSEPDEDDLDDEPVELDDVHFHAVVKPGQPTEQVEASIEVDGHTPMLRCNRCGVVFDQIDDGEDLDSVIAKRDAHRCHEDGQPESEAGAA